MSISRGPKIVTNGLSLTLDAADMNSYSPNVFPNSNDIYGWCGTAGLNACTITRDPSMIRQGASTPMKMTITGTDPYIASYGNSSWNLATASNGQTWTVSVYAKASTATTGELFFFGADSSGGYGGAGTYGGSVTVNIGTSWTRVSASFTINGANVAYAQTRLDGTQAGGSGSIIWWDGLQVERSSAPTPFNPNYYGDTVWKDLIGNNFNGTILNTPAFDGGLPGSFTFSNIATQTVSIPDSSTLQPSSVTLSAWVYVTQYNPLNDFDGQFPTILWKCYDANSGGNASYGLSLAAGQFPRFTITPTQLISSTIFPIATWVHLVGVYTVGGSQILYRNGSVDVSTTGPATIPYSSQVVSVGSRIFNGGYQYPWNGKISNAIIYNRALSATEVLQNFNTTRKRYGV